MAMELVIGVVSMIIGASGLWSVIRRGYLRDRSGWIYARREKHPLYFRIMTGVFALMILSGAFLIWAAWGGRG